MAERGERQRLRSTAQQSGSAFPDRCAEMQYIACGADPQTGSRFFWGSRSRTETDWCERTGDECIDHAVRAHHLPVEREGELLRIRCAFDKNTEFPLAVAFCLCRVKAGEAVLEWTKKQIEPQ